MLTGEWSCMDGAVPRCLNDQEAVSGILTVSEEHTGEEICIPPPLL